MAESANGQQANASGLNAGQANPGQIDVTAITKSVTEQVSKVLTEQFAAKLSELEKNLTVVADTLKQLPPADAKSATADARAGTDAKAGSGAPKPEPLTAESVAKLVREQIEADRKAQAEQAAKDAARASKIEAVTKSTLGGNAALAKLITAADEAGIEQQAKLLAEQAKAALPSFGGGGKDGGTPPNAGSNAQLTPGRYDFIKMPGHSNASPVA